MLNFRGHRLPWCIMISIPLGSRCIGSLLTPNKASNQFCLLDRKGDTALKVSLVEHGWVVGCWCDREVRLSLDSSEMQIPVTTSGGVSLARLKAFRRTRAFTYNRHRFSQVGVHYTAKTSSVVGILNNLRSLQLSPLEFDQRKVYHRAEAQSNYP